MGFEPKSKSPAAPPAARLSAEDHAFFVGAGTGPTNQSSQGMACKLGSAPHRGPVFPDSFTASVEKRGRWGVRRRAPPTARAPERAPRRRRSFVPTWGGEAASGGPGARQEAAEAPEGGARPPAGSRAPDAAHLPRPPEVVAAALLPVAGRPRAGQGERRAADGPKAGAHGGGRRAGRAGARR